MLTYSQRKTLIQDGGRRMDAEIDAALARVAAIRETEHAETRAAYAEKTKPVPFTDEQWKAAKYVRTTTGWHKVVRVNVKSVTVETGYSWTDRYVRGKVMEVR